MKFTKAVKQFVKCCKRNANRLSLSSVSSSTKSTDTEEVETIDCCITEKNQSSPATATHSTSRLKRSPRYWNMLEIEQFALAKGVEVCRLGACHCDPSDVLTLESLVHLQTTCDKCVNCKEQELSQDCTSCGGFAMERPCLICKGECESLWIRDFEQTKSNGQVTWEGACKLNLQNNSDLVCVQT